MMLEEHKRTTYHTPFKPRRSTIFNSTYPSKRNSSALGKTKFRRQIFDQTTNSLRLSQSFRDSVLYLPQTIIPMEDNIIQYDFCGCENKITPCDIIEATFLKNTSIREIKQSYEQISDEIELPMSTVIGSPQKRKNLFLTLPKIYPQIYFPHLKNLMNAIGKELSWAQFSCLSWIEYHAKVQHLSYFLYQDLKKCFKNKNGFLHKVQEHSLNYGQTLANTKGKRYQEVFNHFVSSYYDSIGANLVPLTYYAKFLKIVFEKGNKTLLSLLMKFLRKKTELESCLRFLSHGEITFYRNYVRQLNWDVMLEELNE